MNIVKGKNLVTSILIDGVYYPIFCAKTGELVMDQDEIEVTYINSGIFKDFIPGLNSGSFTATGITSLDNTGGQLSITYIMQEAIRRVIHTLRTTMVDDDGGTLQINYQGFVTNTTLSKQTGAYSQSSVTFRITGGITFSETITPPAEQICEIQETLNLTLAEDALTVGDALLINADAMILAAFREGTEYYQVASSPGNRQFTYDNTTGLLTFQSPGNPGGEGVEVVWQITA